MYMARSVHTVTYENDEFVLFIMPKQHVQRAYNMYLIYTSTYMKFKIHSK